MATMENRNETMSTMDMHAVMTPEQAYELISKDVAADPQESSSLLLDSGPRHRCFPTGALYGYVLFIVLLGVALTTAAVFTFTSLVPHLKTKRFTAANCTTVELRRLGEDVCEWREGVGSAHSLPCAAVLVEHRLAAGTADHHDGDPGEHAADQPVMGMLYDKEENIGRKCSFYPDCGYGEWLLEKEVENSVKRYGANGTNFTCMVDSTSPKTILAKIHFGRFACCSALIPLGVAIILALALLALHWRCGSLLEVGKAAKTLRERRRLLFELKLMYVLLAGPKNTNTNTDTTQQNAV